MSEPRYQLCKECDHFVDDNPAYDDGDAILLAKYDHLEDGEQEFDHEAEPWMAAGEATLMTWREARPDLFYVYPDGKIGPNSRFHSRRGKVDRPVGHALQSRRRHRR
jgi:hypothetical protein